MHDAALVRRVQRVGNLAGDGDGLANRQWPATETHLERLALHQLQYERGDV